MNKRIGLVTAGLVAGLVMVGGTAFAVSSSIPDSAGVVHGCYDSGGNVKVIDTSVTATCPKGYSSLNWNQTGPAGKDGTNGTNGSSVVTSAGVPAGACNPGDADVDLATGEVYTCVAGGGSTGTAGSGAGAGKAGPAGNVWSDTGSSIMGQPGPAGQNGTNAAPEFTWTIACPSGDCAGNVATSSIPGGVVLTPVSITVSAGTCPVQGLVMSAVISDAAGNALASVSWGGSTSSGIRGPDPISAANGNVGALHYVADAECASPFTITFNFDETQAYN